jgi:hypothetical protein
MLDTTPPKNAAYEPTRSATRAAITCAWLKPPIIVASVARRELVKQLRKKRCTKGRQQYWLAARRVRGGGDQLLAVRDASAPIN